MFQPAMGANAIITQPSMNSTNNAELDLDENEANVITNQPLLNDPNNEEQEKKKFSQFNPSTLEKQNQQQSNEEVAESCTWWCFACNNCPQVCDCTGCEYTGCDCTGCCCDNGDCCTWCCEGGLYVDNIDCVDVVGCLECCGTCFEMCNGCCSN